MRNDKNGEDQRTPSSTLRACNGHKDSSFCDFKQKNGTKSGQKNITLFSLQPGLEDAIREVCKEKKIMYIVPRPYVDFKPPKLHADGPCWYIYYSVRNPETGKFKRFRVKVNRGTQKERKTAAREIMASLTQKLQLGWSPMLENLAPRGATSAFTVFDAFEKVKAKEMEAQSIRSYRSFLGRFRRWLESEGFTDRTLITSIDRNVARCYLDYLEDNPDISPATYNNYLSFMVVLFGWIKRRGYVRENVFDGFDRKPKKLTKKKRRCLEPSELQALLGFLSKDNPEYLAICLLCYCCFIRPKEIALLRCGDLDLQNQTVHVSDTIAKNDNESYRTIPTEVLPAFRALDLSNPEFYLFGTHKGNARDFTPGRQPTTVKKIGHFWDRFIKPRPEIGEGVSFYSLKDTGITGMLSEGVSLNFVQQQADHSSPAITGVYVGKTALANEALKGVSLLHKK